MTTIAQQITELQAMLHQERTYFEHREREIMARIHDLRDKCEHPATRTVAGQYCREVYCTDCGEMIEAMI